VTDELMETYDVVVVGGGAAGLNAALALARARRSVMVIDAGEPRNAPAQSVHGFLGHDGLSPAGLLARGREEVRRYGGHIRTGVVTGVARDGEEFVVTVADRSTWRARRLLVTTGLTDELPEVSGAAERWGRDVLHCPYCHGWEVRDQAIGVLGSGPMSVHQALLFRQWSDDVTYISHTVPPDADQAEQLAARGIRVIDGEAAALEVRDDRLRGVRLKDDSVVDVQAVVVSTRMVARAGFLTDLQLAPAPHPGGVGEYLPADPTGRSAAAGVWVAGNVTDLSLQVGPAAASGAQAAAQINADLVAEETRKAVKAHRDRLAAAAESAPA
jgi:thioredoxin reductase